MNQHNRNELCDSLRRLAESNRLTLKLLERTFELLREELALDPLSFWELHKAPLERTQWPFGLNIDAAMLTVSFHGRSCFLGNTLGFKLLSRLAQRPNVYVSRDDLLRDVWDGAIRSNSAVRGAVKELRIKLRTAGLEDLAQAIDGSVRGRYALKLAK